VEDLKKKGSIDLTLFLLQLMKFLTLTAVEKVRITIKGEEIVSLLNILLVHILLYITIKKWRN